MSVVSNTSPLRYLVLIEADRILPVLFGEVIVPTAIVDELSHSHAPEDVRQWILNRPHWLIIQTPSKIDSGLDLDRGEAEAICLATELRAEALLIDDRKGRLAAKSRKITVIGTVSILEAAAKRKLLSLSDALSKLRKTNFRISERQILDALIREQAQLGKSAES